MHFSGSVCALLMTRKAPANLLYVLMYAHTTTYCTHAYIMHKTQTSLRCTGSARTSLETASVRNSEESYRRLNSEEFPRPSSGPLEAATTLSTSLLHYPSSQATGRRPSLSSDIQSCPSPNTSTEHPPFTSARLTLHDAAQPSHDPLAPFGSAPQQQLQPPGSPLRKSLSMDREPHAQSGAAKALHKIQRSSSGSTISRPPNSLPGSLSEAETAAFQRPTGSLADASAIGRGSGSSLSSIFGEPNQWVIDYSDLVSHHGHSTV